MGGPSSPTGIGSSVNPSSVLKSKPNFVNSFEGVVSSLLMHAYINTYFENANLHIIQCNNVSQNSFESRQAFEGNQFSAVPLDQGLCVGNGYILHSVNQALRIYEDSANSTALTAVTALVCQRESSIFIFYHQLWLQPLIFF